MGGRRLEAGRAGATRSRRGRAIPRAGAGPLRPLARARWRPDPGRFRAGGGRFRLDRSAPALPGGGPQTSNLDPSARGAGRAGAGGHTAPGRTARGAVSRRDRAAGAGPDRGASLDGDPGRGAVGGRARGAHGLLLELDRHHRRGGAAGGRVPRGGWRGRVGLRSIGGEQLPQRLRRNAGDRHVCQDRGRQPAAVAGVAGAADGDDRRGAGAGHR